MKVSRPLGTAVADTHPQAVWLAPHNAASPGQVPLVPPG
jgi:hypothetical protein